MRGKSSAVSEGGDVPSVVMGYFNYDVGGGSKTLDAPCKMLCGMWGGNATNNRSDADYMFSLLPGESFEYTLPGSAMSQTLTFTLDGQRIIVDDSFYVVDGTIYYYAIS